eukprot:585740-Prymnesium_polylepis.1
MPSSTSRVIRRARRGHLLANLGQLRLHAVLVLLKRLEPRARCTRLVEQRCRLRWRAGASLVT